MAKRKRKKSKPVEINCFTMRLPPQLREELTKLADADDRSLSSYTRRILEAHVAASKPAALDAVPQNFPHELAPAA